MSRFFRRPAVSRPAQDEPGRLAAGQPGSAGADGSGGSASAGHAPGEPGSGAHRQAGSGPAGYGPAGSASAGYGSAGYGPAAGAPGSGGYGAPGYSQGGYGAPGYGPGGYGQPGYAQSGQPGYPQGGQPGYAQGGQPGYAHSGHPGYAPGGPGAGWGAYGAGGPAAYGPGGPGAGGYGEYGAGQGDGNRPWWRHRGVLAGVSVVAAGTLAFAGLGAADAFGSSTLTTAQITQKVSPGLVDIVSSLGFQQARAAGTGMVLTPNGEVLTNNHVIDGATSIKATDIGNGRTYTAKVVGYSKTNDVAVLKLVGASGLDTITLSSDPAQVGDKVVALGNAGGKGGAPSVVTGKVTGLGKTITASDETAANAEQLTDMTRTNANIQPGDSGGPLVNTSGEIIGMNTAASSGPSMTSFQQGAEKPQTEAFAIPISKADSLADQITAGQASATVHIGGTAFLGVQVSSGSAGDTGGFGGFGDFGGGSASNGATIAGVVPGSAAEQAGLGQGDTITSVAGHAITSPTGVSSVLHNHHPGDKVSIGWTDQTGQSHTATVTLGNGPAD